MDGGGEGGGGGGRGSLGAFWEDHIIFRRNGAGVRPVVVNRLKRGLHLNIFVPSQAVRAFCVMDEVLHRSQVEDVLTVNIPYAILI